MYIIFGFPSGSDDKESDCNARDLGPIPGLGRPKNNDKGVGIRSIGFFTVELAMLHPYDGRYTGPWEGREGRQLFLHTKGNFGN